MLKKLFLNIFCLGMVVALVGCNHAEVDSNSSGNIQLSISTDSKVAGVVVKSAGINSPCYSLSIQNLYGQEQEFFEDCSLISNLKIEAGDYNFVIKSGEDDALPRIDAPYYYGKTKVSVVAAQTNNVTITGKLKNARVSAEFSEVIKDEKIFSDYSFTLGDVVLTKNDIENGSSLFVSAGASKSYNWSVKLTNVQGGESEFSGVLTGVEECSHYTYSFDVDVTMDEDEGTAGFEIVVDDEVRVESDQIEINLEQRPAPSFEGEGFVVGETKVVRDIEPRQDVMKLAIRAEEGAEEVTLRHLSEELYEAGVPYTINFSSATAEEISALQSAGITLDGFAVASREMLFDCSEYVNSMPLGNYTFYITVIDRVKQSSGATVDFMVVPDMDHLPVSAVCGAKYAVLSGEWCSLVQPEGLCFQYRKVGDSEWTNSSVDDLVVTSQEKKTFTTRIVNIDASSQYEFRTYSDAAQYDRTETFTTEAAPEIPNLNFDSGYYDGSTWYPNASGGNSYWATGNEGVCDWPLSMSSITNHTDDAVSGKAVVMKSAAITYSLSPVKFAAGNLYVGTYKTNMSSPASSATMGRPYTGKPLGLKGWYKYTPANINKDQDGVSGSDYGKADYAHIYLTLEDWGSATSRPSNPTIIATGEFKTNQTVTTYQQFSFMLEYSSSRTPTHAVLATTSSYYGVDFCGGVGSTLYIDEFELIWY